MNAEPLNLDFSKFQIFRHQLLEIIHGGAVYAAMNDQEASELRLFHEEIREMGIDCKLMNGTEARRLEPLLCRDVVGALHNPSCYHLNPFRLIEGYLDAALRRRCRAQYGVDVKEIKINNGRIERGRT